MNIKTNKILKVIFSLVMFTISYAIVFKQANIVGTDYYCHSHFYEETNQYKYMQMYPLWHYLVYALYTLINSICNIDISYSCAIVTASLYVVQYLLVDYYLEKSNNPLHSIVSFLLCIVTAIYVPFINYMIYDGVESPNIWHNPTNAMVKPFSIFIFIFICKILDIYDSNEDISIKNYIELSLLVLISVFCKPAFFQGIVPGLGLLLVFVNILDKGKNIVKHIKLCACFLPATLVVIYQFLYSFNTSNGGSSVGIGWFEMNKITGVNPYISTLQVLAFPIIYLIFNYKKIKNSNYIKLSITFLIASWLEFAVLYENGPRILHGNFRWALLLSYFMIWMVTTKNFLCDIKNCENPLKNIKLLLLMIVWVLHLLSGILYIWQLLFIPDCWY